MENSKKQTAVEYLVKEFSEIIGKIETTPMQDLLLVDAMNKSKEMENKQIIDAVNSQRQLGWDEKGEQYYNETFKK